MTVYLVTVRTLTPLHIGDGNELRQGFDFAVRNGRTYRLDEDAILREKEAQIKPNAKGEYPTPQELLTEDDYQNPLFFRYVLPGVPRSKKTDARVRSFIKDVYNRPYIPGSSLKGAVRTALAWTGWNEIKPQLERAAIGRSKSWAGQPLERKLFGPDPNHDLLRALHVSDLTGPTSANASMMLVNAQVLTKKGAGSPVELEAVRTKVEFRGTLTMDDVLFTDLAERELHFAKRKHWLDELLMRIQAHSRARLEQLAAWYETADQCEEVARYVRQLAATKLPAHQAVLQIGWGAGWDAKTFWTHLQTDAPLFEQLVADFGLHRAPKGSPKRKPGDPFPRSRRVVMGDKNGVEKPVAPLGWVLLEVKAQ
ncbi:MAG: type III-A CRISPR-associated RAMP protein Csm5 [Anaerolineae bacterium]|nr:type III-A CRISPR-associated RAMP protein Csm5 [Anaerolineae bacterium]